MNEGKQEQIKVVFQNSLNFYRPEVFSDVLRIKNRKFSYDIQCCEASSELELLDSDTRPWVTILFDVNNILAQTTARKLSNKLQQRNFAVYSRKVNFNDPTTVNHLNSRRLSELRCHFQMIADSQIIIVLLSTSFLENIDCCLEYTLALIQHAANYPRQRMLTFALSEEIFHNMDTINDVFHREFIHVMVDRDTNSPVHLSDNAIDYFCDRVILQDGRLIYIINADWFPTNLEQNASVLNIVSPRPTQQSTPSRLLICSDTHDEEKINKLVIYIRQEIPNCDIMEPVRYNGRATISEEVAKGTNDLIVLFLITQQFINDENSMNTVYEIFLCLYNCPLVRVVHLNPNDDESQIPNFIKRIPSIKRQENESDAIFYAKVLSWVKDTSPNSQSGVLIEPPDCFRISVDPGQLMMNNVVFTHSE